MCSRRSLTLSVSRSDESSTIVCFRSYFSDTREGIYMPDSAYTTDFLVDGELINPTTDRAFETEDPSRGTVLTAVPAGNERDVDRAVTAARTAFDDYWADTDPDERARVLERIAAVFRENSELLTDIEVENNGSSRSKMADDVLKAADRLEYFAGLVKEIKGQTVETPGNTINYTLREPIGVVAGIVPFNHPLSFVGSKIGPALAAGNTIVIKPSEQTPLSALALGELLAADSEIPDGVVNIIAGDAETGAHLTGHDDVGMITLIGSVEAGKAVMRSAADNVAPTLLELGGKNPAIVFPDADLDEAIPGCVSGMSLNWQGQSCGSSSRVLVHEDVHDELVDGLVERFEAITAGMPDDDAADMGAVVSRDHYENVLEYIELGRKSDATLLTGGEPAEVEGTDGYFIEPTIFDDVDPESRIAQEEIFGPVLSVITWSEYDEVVEIANGVDYGLTASIWTNNLRTGLETADNLDAGYIWINQHGSHYMGAPFGGVKESGIGRTHCLEELYEHTRTKNVNVNLDQSQWEW